jgi:SAM-dependent methyltransferase
VSQPPLTLSGWLRFDVVDRMLRSLDGVRSILEIGSGQGALGARLARRYRYTGLEPDHAAATTARIRVEEAGGTLICGDLEALEPRRLFDLVCAFEVLEHLSDDGAELQAWSFRIRPGGWLMLTVPPFTRRFGAADRSVGHLRRYEPESLIALLESTGLRDARTVLYGFPFGRALETGRNLLAQMTPARGSLTERSAASGRRYQPPDELGWLTQAVAWPLRAAQRPFIGSRRGSNLLAIARRP